MEKDQVNENNVSSTLEEPIIIQTDIGSKSGQNKCPKCGATLRPHRACTKCGFYKGEEVIKVSDSEE